MFMIQVVYYCLKVDLRYSLYGNQHPHLSYTVKTNKVFKYINKYTKAFILASPVLTNKTVCFILNTNTYLVRT